MQYQLKSESASHFYDCIMSLYCQHTLTHQPFAFGVRRAQMWCMKVTQYLGLRGEEKGMLFQWPCWAYFWCLYRWRLRVRGGGGGPCFTFLGPSCLCRPSFSRFKPAAVALVGTWYKRKLASWVLLYFNHLMSLCPVQYQFFKVSGALHEIKSFDTLPPCSKCNKNILAYLSQWHSAGENLSHCVWPNVLEMHIKIIPSCWMVLLVILKIQLDGCHLGI